MKISYYSQYGTIIRAFQDHPWHRLWVAFFQKWNYFVWYKASSRLSELVNKWYLIRSDFDEIGSNWQKFAQYELSKIWANVDIPKPTRMERILHYMKNVF